MALITIKGKGLITPLTPWGVNGVTGMTAHAQYGCQDYSILAEYSVSPELFLSQAISQVH